MIFLKINISNLAFGQELRRKAILKPLWDDVEATLRPTWANLAPTWPTCCHFWTSSSHLEANWGILGADLANLRAALDDVGLLRPSGGHVRNKCEKRAESREQRAESREQRPLTFLFEMPRFRAALFRLWTERAHDGFEPDGSAVISDVLPCSVAMRLYSLLPVLAHVSARLASVRPTDSARLLEEFQW